MFETQKCLCVRVGVRVCGVFACMCLEVWGEVFAVET